MAAIAFLSRLSQAFLYADFSLFISLITKFPILIADDHRAWDKRDRKAIAAIVKLKKKKCRQLI